MNNQDILQYLKYQEKRVEGQLEALRMSITTIENAFNGVEEPVLTPVSVSEKPSTSSGVILEPSTKESVAAKSAKVKGPFVENWEVKPSNDTKGKGTRPVKLGKTYKENKSFTKKIAFLLLKEGERSTVELIDRIKELEPGEASIKIERSVAIGTSSMYRKGLVEAKKEGRRYIYSLKAKNEA